MAAGDARAMGQSIKHLLTKESVEAFAGMSKKEARYLTRAVESLAKETGDYVSDHLFATLRSQFEKGTSCAKAVKFAKDLFHKREAVGRIYDYLDDAARAALYELAETEDVLQEEIEQLGKIAQTYQAEAGKTITKTQLDDLLGDSTLGEKSVEEVVARLVESGKIHFVKNEISQLLEVYPELEGSNREKLLNLVQDSKLSRLINELYRPGATIGDGGTADILISEYYAGSSKHLTKAKARLTEIKRLISSGVLGLNDLDIAEALRDDLEIAIKLFD